MKTERRRTTGFLLVPVLLAAASAHGQAPPAAAAAPAGAGPSTPRDPKSPVPGAADGQGPTGPVSLKILKPTPGEEIPLTGDSSAGAVVHVTFDLKNFPTFLDPATRTGQGVAIFFDSVPYFIHYDPSKPWGFRKVPPGTHTIRAVPIRPWGEPIREKDAFAMVTFRVGPKSEKAAPAADEPVLTVLSPRPGAKYPAAGAAALRFEYLVRGCRVTEEHAPDSCRVRYRVDAQPEVILTAPGSVPLSGLEPGRHGFSVGLTREGKLIPGTFTLVQTAFEVVEAPR